MNYLAWLLGKIYECFEVFMMLSLKKKLLLSAAIVVGVSQFGFIASADPVDESQVRHNHIVPGGPISDNQIADLKQAASTMKQSVAASPFIIETAEGKKASELLSKMQNDLLTLNNLSYNKVKGGGDYLKFEVHDQEALQAKGWTMKGFTGLEGRYSTFEDLSGLVAHNAKENVIVVALHGTATVDDELTKENNGAGWQTNFDAEKIPAKQVKQEFTKDLYVKTMKDLKDAAEKENIPELRKFLKSIKAEEFNGENLEKAKKMIADLMAENKMDLDIGRNILHNIRMKQEIVDYLDKTGCNLEGQIHKGFAKKWYSSKKEVVELLKETLAGMTPEQRRTVKIIITGHSMAGGTGSLAQADLTANHGKELFGEDFDNKTWGTFNGYLLSKARTGDSDYVKFFHKHVGKDYLAVQDCDGDPVTFASGDKEVAKLIHEMIPAAGEILAKSMAGYADEGHYLIDDAQETWERSLALYKDSGIAIDDFATLDEAVNYLASWMVDEKKIPAALVSNKPQRSAWNPLNKFARWYNVYKTGSMIKGAMKGDEKAKKKAATLLGRRLAFIHYGHHDDAMGAVFNPAVVGRDLNKMLARGHEYEKNKEAKHAAEKQKAKDVRAEKAEQKKVMLQEKADKRKKVKAEE
jgi:hypothetical protein